jgi:hypothetical protein
MQYTFTLLAVLRAAAVVAQEIAFQVPTTPAEVETGRPGDGFLALSIELACFPDYAGNLSSPNEFSHNLLNNLAELAGKQMNIRVGGNTQDLYIYNSSLGVQLMGEYNLNRSHDYPTENLQIGPSFFESYKTWPGYTFSHGLNMGGNKHPNAWQSLLETAQAACTYMGANATKVWEYGNEPNSFPNAGQYSVRGPDFKDGVYVQEWLNGTRAVQDVVAEHCPDMAGEAFAGWMAPSIVNIQTMTRPIYTDNPDRIVLNLTEVWALGQNATSNVVQYGLHNYIDNALGPVSLAGTLLNHTRTRLAADYVLDLYSQVDTNLPLIFSEHNSIALQGSPGLSNAFGAALWAVDLNLYVASRGVHRSHMHTGTNYRYQPWQPIETERVVKGTKAPYYGQIAVAAFIGDNSETPVDVAHISPMAEDGEDLWDVAYAAYAAYVEDQLSRVLLLNMRPYNHTQGGLGGSQLNQEERPVRQFTLAVNSIDDGTVVAVRRLRGNGSDAITGITFDGWSYNWELDNGKPVRLENVTTGETVTVRNGIIAMQLPDSEAVILDFHSGSNGSDGDEPVPAAGARLGRQSGSLLVALVTIFLV